MKRKASQLNLASFEKRVLAFLIDFSIMFAIAVLLLLETVLSLVAGNWIIVTLNLLFIALGILWVYSTLFEGFNGQSVGKRVLGLMVIRADGRKVDYEHAAVRNFGKILLPFDLAFGYTIKDPKFIRYFDKFAGTTVIDVRKS